MNNVAIHSICALDRNAVSRSWRIASAIVPVAIADLTVTREETLELSPARALLLETIRFLGEDGGTAKLAELAELSGIGDHALMAGILVPLASEGIVLIEGESVRQSPALIIDGEAARIVVDSEEAVCVIGSPPVPVHGIDQQRLKKLRAIDANTDSIAIGEDVLEAWRTAFWDADTHCLQLREPLQPNLYVLEGHATGEIVLDLRDDRYSARVNILADHPFVDQLLAEVHPILEAAPQLLRRYGVWNGEQSELRCSAAQWERWCAAGGRSDAEVLVRGSVDVAISVHCRPADATAARAMLLEDVTGQFDGSLEPCTAGQLEDISVNLRQSPALRDYDLPTPTLSEIEAFAWDSGRWELAYRIARTADRL